MGMMKNVSLVLLDFPIFQEKQKKKEKSDFLKMQNITIFNIGEPSKII